MPHFLQATNATANPNVPLVPGVIPINQLTNQLLAARVITGYNFSWNAIFYIENIIVGQQLFYIPHATCRGHSLYLDPVPGYHNGGLWID